MRSDRYSNLTVSPWYKTIKVLCSWDQRDPIKHEFYLRDHEIWVIMIEIMIRVTVVNVKQDTASNNLSHFPLFVLLLVIAGSNVAPGHFWCLLSPVYDTASCQGPVVTMDQYTTKVSHSLAHPPRQAPWPLVPSITTSVQSVPAHHNPIINIFT